MSRYWEQRYSNITQARIVTENISIREITRLHRRTNRLIQRDIDRFYERYAENDNITLTEARRMLSRQEQQNWSMTLREFRRKAKEGGYDQELNREYYRSRVSRLQQLQTQVNMHIRELAYSSIDATTSHLTNVVDDTFYRTAHLIDQQRGISANFAKLDKQAVNAMMQTSFHGRHFSQRIWGNNTRKLTRELTQTLTAGLMQGHGIDKIARDLNERMGVARNRAVTIIRTESSHISAQATMETYDRLEVEQFQFSALLEIRTCECCQELDGQVFDMTKKKIGVNTNPIHPNCRCFTVPYIPDSPRERWGRNPVTGRLERVGDVTYEDWRANTNREHGKDTLDDILMRHRNKARDKRELAELRQVIGRNDSPKSLAKFQDIRYNNPKAWDELKHQRYVFNRIDARDWVQATKRRAKQNYRRFMEQGFSPSFHATEKWTARSGQSSIDIRGAAEILRTNPNYIDTRNGRPIWLRGKDNFVMDEDRTRIITYIHREHGRPSKNWRRI